MKSYLLAPLVAVGLVGAAHAQETFDVNFSAGPEGVTGTITLASDTTGLVSSNEILGYTLGSALGDPVAFTVNGSSTSGFGPGIFTVQGNNLLFTPLPWVPGSPCTTCDGNSEQQITFGNTLYDWLIFQGPGFQGFPTDHGTDGPGAGPGIGVSYDSPQSEGWSLPADTVIGTTAQPAPEISDAGAISALTLLLGTLVVLRGQRQRTY
jgi:hypothetical protein